MYRRVHPRRPRRNPAGALAQNGPLTPVAPGPCVDSALMAPSLNLQPSRHVEEDDIAGAVKAELSQVSTTSAMVTSCNLVTDIDPDAKV